MLKSEFQLWVCSCLATVDIFRPHNYRITLTDMTSAICMRVTMILCATDRDLKFDRGEVWVRLQRNRW
jgi:hypothetical protein